MFNFIKSIQPRESCLQASKLIELYYTYRNLITVILRTITSYYEYFAHILNEYNNDKYKGMLL